MNLEEVRDYCLGKPHVTEDMPFGDGYVTFRIARKIFCCMVLLHGSVVQLKWPPDEFDATLAEFPWVHQAWHWHKRHMIQFDVTDPAVSGREASALIDRAYAYVVSRLPKRLRQELAGSWDCPREVGMME